VLISEHGPLPDEGTMTLCALPRKNLWRGSGHHRRHRQRALARDKEGPQPGGSVMFKALLTGIAQLFMIGAACAAGSLQFTCSGDMIEPAGLARAPITLGVVFSPTNHVSKVTVDFGQRTVNAPVMSNNIIQLKFRTRDFIGEYFYYDRDMFLIYKSGHLARLACTPR
jgi:hypothetical protein